MQLDDQDIAEHDAETGNDPIGETGELDSQLMAEHRPPINRGAFGLFALFLALGGGTYFMYLKTGPQSANAANADAGVISTISDFLTGKVGGVQMMRQTLADSEKVVAEFKASSVRPQVPLSDLRINPFRHIATNNAMAEASEASIRRQREEERKSVLKAVQGLQLQSVIHSDARRACMINNAMFQEGQQLEGFTIEQIAAQAVVVRNGMYRFELRMQR
jgi:hypothetical protein